CLVVVLIYAAVMVACAAGWIVRDWSEEVAVTYAPPTFLGPEAPRGAPAAAAETAPQAALEDYGIPDPLADDLAEIARELAGTSATETRAATLAFGADKWGRDVLKKAGKGTETSLFVGLVQLSLHVVLFVKSEVILGFPGFGVGVDTVSWGSMLAEAQSELILGKWWQIAAATFAMAVLVTAFSLLTDALRDALDPRLK